MGKLSVYHRLIPNFKIIFPTAFFALSLLLFQLVTNYADFQAREPKTGEIYDVGCGGKDCSNGSSHGNDSGNNNRSHSDNTGHDAQAKKTTPAPAKIGMGDVQRAGNQFNNGVPLTEEMQKAQQEMASRTGGSNQTNGAVPTAAPTIAPVGKPIADCPTASQNFVTGQVDKNIFSQLWSQIIAFLGFTNVNQPEIMVSEPCRTPLFDSGIRATVARNPEDAGNIAWDTAKRQGLTDDQARLAAQTAWNKFATEHPETVIPEDKAIGNQMDVNRQQEIDKIKKEICSQNKCTDWNKIDTNTFSADQITRVREAGNQAIYDYYKAQKAAGKTVVPDTTVTTTLTSGYIPSAIAKDKCSSLGGGDQSNCQQVVDKTIAASIKEGKGIPLDQYLVIKDGKVVDIDWKNFGTAMSKLGDNNPINPRAVAYAEAARQGIDLSKFSPQQLDQISVSGGRVTDMISIMTAIENDKKAGLLPVNGVFGLKGDQQFKIMRIDSAGNPVIGAVDGPTTISFILPPGTADITKYGIDKDLYNSLKQAYADQYKKYQADLAKQKAAAIEDQATKKALAPTQKDLEIAQQGLNKMDRLEAQDVARQQKIQADLQTSALEISMQKMQEIGQQNIQANLNLVNVLRDNNGLGENTNVTGVDGDNFDYFVSSINTQTGLVTLQGTDDQGNIQIKEKKLAEFYKQVYTGQIKQVTYISGNGLAEKIPEAPKPPSTLDLIVSGVKIPGNWTWLTGSAQPSPTTADQVTPEVVNPDQAALDIQSEAVVNDTFPLQFASKLDSIVAPETGKAELAINNDEAQLQAERTLNRSDLLETKQALNAANNDLIAARSENDPQAISKAKETIANLEAAGQGLAEENLSLRYKESSLTTDLAAVPPTQWDFLFNTDRAKNYREAAIQAAAASPSFVTKGSVVEAYPYYHFTDADLAEAASIRSDLKSKGQLLGPDIKKLIDEGIAQITKTKDGVYIVDYIPGQGKYGSIYGVGAFRAEYRLGNGGWGVGLGQNPDSCWTHSVMLAVSELKPGSVIVNPYLLSELLVPGSIEAEKLFVMQDPAVMDTYCPGNKPSCQDTYNTAVIAGAFNTAFQQNFETSTILANNFGIKLDQSFSLFGVKNDSNPMMSYSEWLLHNSSVPSSDKFVNYMEDQYTTLTKDDPLNTKVVFSLQSTPKMRHAYLILDIQDVNGEKYFHATSGQFGTESTWPFYQNKVITLKDKTILIPIKEISQWKTWSDEDTPNMLTLKNISNEPALQVATQIKPSSVIATDTQTSMGQSVAAMAIQNIGNYENKAEGLDKGDVINYIKNGTWDRAWTTVNKTNYWVSRDAEGKNLVVYTENTDKSINIIGKVPL